MALETKRHHGRGVCLPGLVIFRDLAGHKVVGSGMLPSGWKRRSREVVSGSEADDSHLLAAASSREHLHVCGASGGGVADVRAEACWEQRQRGGGQG